MSNRPQEHERIVNGPPASPTAIIPAHGAGAGMDTDFMNAFAEGLADHDFRVVRFEFPYMAERRQTGKRRPPDREPVLRQTWLDVIASVEANTLFIGGKSMGGRIASLIADEASVAGLICLGVLTISGLLGASGAPDLIRRSPLTIAGLVGLAAALGVVSLMVSPDEPKQPAATA